MTQRTRNTRYQQIKVVQPFSYSGRMRSYTKVSICLNIEVLTFFVADADWQGNCNESCISPLPSNGFEESVGDQGEAFAC